MSRPQPTRPGALPRPPLVGRQNAGNTGTTGRQPENLDEIRNLPAFIEDGPNVDLDPENSSAGKIVDETVTIASAKYETMTWQRKDGSFPENSKPEAPLKVYMSRIGDEAGDRPYEAQYKYGLSVLFAPSKDGNHIRVRPDKIKEGANPPRPRKYSPAVLFLQSIKDAGGKNIIERINKEGIKALTGLTVHVRERKVEGMHENAKPVLLVDFIEGSTPSGGSTGGGSAPAPKSVGSAAVPAPAVVKQEVVAASVSSATLSEAEQLAEQALTDILSQSDNLTVSRSKIAPALVRIDKWKEHPQRPAILTALRDDNFINRSTAPWKFDAATNNLTLA